MGMPEQSLRQRRLSARSHPRLLREAAVRAMPTTLASTNDPTAMASVIPRPETTSFQRPSVTKVLSSFPSISSRMLLVAVPVSR